MSAQGIIVLHFTPRQIKRNRNELATSIKSALAAGRPRPRVQALPAR
ncbi:MAG TPA: hypothetical protein VH641_21100 [Streptosporangiaceae bacterium]|jgi:hypothetical protein